MTEEALLEGGTLAGGASPSKSAVKRIAEHGEGAPNEAWTLDSSAEYHGTSSVSPLLEC